MLDPTQFLIFVAAAVALSVTPGPDMMFVAGTGLAHGPRAGLAASAGIAAGCLVHAVLAAVGVGAVLAAAPLAFDLLRWAGAAYLLWCAVEIWRSGPLKATAAPPGTAAIFRKGALTDALNPKVMLFFMALLPQFVPPSAEHPGLTALMLGLVVIAVGLVVNGVVGLGAGRLGLAARPRAGRWLGRVCGGIYAALALRLLFVEKAA